MKVTRINPEDLKQLLGDDYEMYRILEEEKNNKGGKRDV